MPERSRAVRLIKLVQVVVFVLWVIAVVLRLMDKLDMSQFKGAVLIAFVLMFGLSLLRLGLKQSAAGAPED